jgi:hypothetical protein
MRTWLLTAAAVLLISGNAAAQTEDSASEGSSRDKGSASKGEGADSDSDGDEGRAAGASTIDDNARYAWLSAELTKIEGPTERWHTGWLWGFTWLTASQLALGASAPTIGLREDSYVGAAVGALGLVSVLIQPNTMDGALDTLKSYDGSSPLGRYERLRRAEYYLRSTAQEERFEHSVIPFALATVVNCAAAYLLVHTYGQDLAGYASLAAGEVVTLVQIFSRPYSATHAWERYQKSYHPFPPSEVPPDQIELPDQLHLSFVIGPAGLGARATF